MNWYQCCQLNEKLEEAIHRADRASIETAELKAELKKFCSKASEPERHEVGTQNAQSGQTSQLIATENTANILCRE